jgi:hypothetical protein
MSIMMKRYPAIGAILFLAIAEGLIVPHTVQADPTYNIVNDYRFYTYSEYRAKRQYDHTLQVRVIDDLRPQAEREPQHHPSIATDDSFWMYPVPEMLERLLFREFALSFLFRKVGRNETRSSLILELVLKSFHAYKEKTGLVTRRIYGDVAFSASLVQRAPRKRLFTKDYHCQTSVKLTPVIKSGDYLVRQITTSLAELVPVLMADMERVLEGMRPPKKIQASPRRKPKLSKQKTQRPKQKTKPIDLEPVGPK